MAVRAHVPLPGFSVRMDPPSVPRRRHGSARHLEESGESVSVVMTDYTMPGMDGATFYTR